MISCSTCSVCSEGPVEEMRCFAFKEMESSLSIRFIATIGLGTLIAIICGARTIC